MGFRALGFRALGFRAMGFRDWGFGLRVEEFTGFGLRVEEFRVKGLGLKVEGFPCARSPQRLHALLLNQLAHLLCLRDLEVHGT